MIQDGIDYGEGFCRADKPGMDVEWLANKGWEKRSYPLHDFENGIAYRQPIKPKPIKLQVGERYRMRNGEIVGPLEHFSDNEPFDFIDDKKLETWRIDGSYGLSGRESNKDIIEHITTEKQMEETFIEIKGRIKNNGPDVIQAINENRNPIKFSLPISEIERLYAEAQRIKADNEIKAGDLFYIFGSIRKCFAWKNGEILDVDGQIHDKTKCKKIIDLTRPLNEIYEGIK